MNNLDAIFSPESVVVIGASTTAGKVGHDIFANILKGGYSGILYPVNPGARSVLSVKAYPTVMDVPDNVDLSIIILPPDLAVKAVDQCIKKGTRGIIIVSAGFREIGAEGLAKENRILKACQEAGVRLVGPNCLGVINPQADISLNASFSPRMPKPGNISFISQSGALCTAVLDFAADRDFGFSKFISIGNKADVEELDLLRYFHNDLDTEVIMLYIEELSRGPEFIEAVKEITSGSRPTPILAIKSGRTSAGAAAAASHTGSLAGSEGVYDAIFQQTGIIRVDSINELFDFASAFAYKNETNLGKFRRKVPDGNQVAIVTNAGGPGIVATDMTVSSGLKLAKFQDETIEVLASHLPVTANLHNPVDIIGDASQDRYENALDAVIKDTGVDGALVILTPQSMTNALGTAEAIMRIARRTHKPILCCFMGVVDVSAGVKYLQEGGVPVFRFPESAAKAFGAIYKYSQWLNRQELAQFKLSYDQEKASEIIAAALEQGKDSLGEIEGSEFLKCYGFNILSSLLAQNAQEAVKMSDEMGYPVVLKIVSPHILHKSEAGGVMVDLRDDKAVEDGFNQIMKNAAIYNSKAEIHGVMIRKMVTTGDEVILGMNRHPVFGPLLMFGLGGIYVELFKDVVFRLAPIFRNEARRMIRQIRGYKLFKGFRGRPLADLEIIEKSMVSLSKMSVSHPEIIEMDINPLIVHAQGEGATVVDCRIILKPAE